jgi:MATE family multidrug resistance protein
MDMRVALSPPAVTRMSLRQHIRRTVALAVPVMLARAGLIIMMTVGTVMVGQSGPHELAWYAISLAPQNMMLVIGIGLLIGGAVLTAQADGARRSEQCGRIWKQTMIVASCVGLAYAVALQWSEAILLGLGQTPEIAVGGGRVLRQFAAGMPPILLFVACSGFLEGIGRPKPGMIAALAFNLLNALLCWLLIFGHWGLPALGAEGAAIAATITRWLMVAAIIGYILAMKDGAHYGVRLPLAGHHGGIVKQLRLGLPLAVAAGLETSAFGATAIFAGWLGETSLAAFQIGLNVCTLAFMLTMGVSTAAGVRVANAIGRQDRIGMKRAGWTAAGMIATLMIVVGLFIGLQRQWIAGAYTDNPAVVALAVPTLGVVALLVLFDGLQGVLMGTTRGAADVVVPLTMHACSFWIITIPLAYWVVSSTAYGAVGLFWTLFAGLVSASLLLGYRFHTLSGRNIRPL